MTAKKKTKRVTAHTDNHQASSQMKTPTDRRAGKLPKARIMFANLGDLTLPCSHKIFPVRDLREHIVATEPCIVLPCATAAEARRRLKFAAMTEQEQHRALSERFSRHFYPAKCDHLATLALKIIKGQQ